MGAMKITQLLVPITVVAQFAAQFGACGHAFA